MSRVRTGFGRLSPKSGASRPGRPTETGGSLVRWPRGLAIRSEDGLTPDEPGCVGFCGVRRVARPVRMPSPALLGGHAPHEDPALPLPYDALAYSPGATIMTASARFPTSSLGANPSMRLSALPGPRTGPGDPFDTSRFSEAQPAFASPAMPPSRYGTDSVDGNVRAALGPAPGLAARALPHVVGPDLDAVLARSCRPFVLLAGSAPSLEQILKLGHELPDDICRIKVKCCINRC